jgi:uncharacterized delta-60 repeat protein
MRHSTIFGFAAVAAVTVAVAPARTVDRAVGVRLGSSSHAGAQALAVQADGKLVAAGWSRTVGGKFKRFALARYTSAGRLDASFGQGGKVVTDLGSGSDTTALDVALQRDGKIVAVGLGSNGFELVRYRASGRLDTTFGSGGEVLTSVGRYSGASAIAIQRDGKLVVTGWSQADFSGTPRLALVRYTRSGKLDASFGRGGRVPTSIASADDRQVGAVAVQPDGGIVVAYRSGVARYNADGTLDPTFGAGGEVATETGVTTLGVQRDGKIVAVGYGPVVTRYSSDGSLDASFGTDGTVRTSWRSKASPDAGGADRSLAIQVDGKLVVAGWSDALNHRGDHPNTPNDDIALARYTPEGRLDTSFGRGGKVLTSFDVSGNWETRAWGVVIQPNGKIVVAGDRSLGAGDESRGFLLVRYSRQGRLDGSFGRGGKLLTDFGSG